MNAKIWIEPTGKTLRLVWYYEGKRRRLSLGIPDNSIGRALAAKKMAEIKIDLESGYYDTTLFKYRPRKLGANPTEISAVQLFEKYLTHYQQQRSRSRDNNRVPKQPKPFTIAEFQAIVSAFVNHPQYSHYTNFVLFLANSACCPGEAAGLR